MFYLLLITSLIVPRNCLRLATRALSSSATVPRNVAPVERGSPNRYPTEWPAAVHRWLARTFVVSASGNGGLLWATENLVASWDKTLEAATKSDQNLSRSDTPASSPCPGREYKMITSSVFVIEISDSTLESVKATQKPVTIRQRLIKYLAATFHY